MLVPSEWLQSYIKKSLTPAQMCTAMEKAGIEVEGIREFSKLDSKIITVKVTGVRKHPNADRLRLAKINIGGRQVELVCGAPNLRVGMLTVWVPPGAKLPGGAEVREVEIRGVSSRGMLASAKELGISEDHSGIINLDASTKVGQAAQRYLGRSGVVIDTKTAANRPDLLSLIGIAREVAAHAGTSLKPRLDLPVYETPRVELFTNKSKEKVPRYTLAKVKLSKSIGPSPDWLRQRLELAGIRPINVVVDITNYVMVELGQPLHAFDSTKVRGKVQVRQAKSGEKLKTLDGVERKLERSDIVIADSGKAIGIAGVMGGANSEISASTKTILLEAATFDSASVRKTAQRYGLRSEASARFEKSLPVQLVPLAVQRALELLNELVGARVERVDDELNVWPWVQHIGARPAKISALAGLKIEPKTVVSGLRTLGFVAEEFDIVREARKHLGKPFISGASFKTHGTTAFDCSYLSDYIYSLIGMQIGHTAYEQSTTGWKIKPSELRPGDQIFRGGPWKLHDPKERHGVSHNYIYIGNGQVIHAKSWQRNDDGDWQEAARSEVVIEPATVGLDDPDFLMTRRYVDDLNQFVAVTVPWWRPDVKTEEDILEEVVKMVGLDKVPNTLPVGVGSTSYDNSLLRQWELRGLLAGLGYFEVNTYPFVSKQLLSAVGVSLKDTLKLANPRSPEQEHLRPSLLPGLLQAATNNRSYGAEYGMFEMGKIFLPQAGKLLPSEPLQLAVIETGLNTQSVYKRLKASLDQLDARLHADINIRMTRQRSYLDPQYQAVLTTPKGNIGNIGVFHPRLLQEFKLKAAAWLSIDVNRFLRSSTLPRLKAVSRYAPAKRDITVTINRRYGWQEVAKALEKLSSLKAEYVDEFFEPGMGDQRALTIHLEFTSDEGTLTDADATALQDKVLNVLAKKFKAVARS